MIELEIRAGEELERRLARYGRVRLDPSAAQARRARGAIMEAAWRRRIAGPSAADTRTARVTDATVAPLATRSRSGLYAGWGPRRLGASLGAAALAGLLVGSTAFAASRAGAPLYDARIALEELTLPTDPASRFEARIAQAQSRLVEIVEAVARDDRGALAASVDAYDEAVAKLSESTGGAADRALIAIESHEAVLREVQARAPEAAQAGLANAIEHSGTVVTKLDAAGATPGVSNGSGSGNGGSGSGGGTGGADNGNVGGSGGAGSGSGSGAGAGGAGAGGAGNGNGGAKPTAEPDPQATAEPHRTPPAKSPRPDATKPPKADSGGGQGSGQGKP